MNLANPVPVDVPLLAELIRRTDARNDGGDLYEQLADQVGDEQARLLWDAACADIHAQAEVDNVRETLREDLDAALDAIARVKAKLSDLRSSPAWPALQADATAVFDIHSFLDDAARSLRAAKALDPVPR